MSRVCELTGKGPMSGNTISISQNLKDKLKDAAIYPEVKHSDHCPVYAELDL